MNKFFTSLITLLACSASAQAQVIVNPDGTHSVAMGNIIVNSDGTHSVRTGDVIVNPNGTHSVISGNVLVTPDGKHVPFFDTGQKEADHKAAARDDNRYRYGAMTQRSLWLKRMDALKKQRREERKLRKARNKCEMFFTVPLDDVYGSQKNYMNNLLSVKITLSLHHHNLGL